VIEIYYQTNQKDKAIQYLKSNKINDMLLLGLYKEKKDYIKAAKLARKIYTRTKDYDMLAQIAMLEYEVLLQKRIKNKKKNKKKLRNIIANLKLALKKKANPSYYNYLGYIMIDNAMGTKQGIRYVQHALKKEPDNPYYLDSLAWGHYKLGECKKAKKIMKTVIEKLGTKDEEVRYHLKMLEQCKEQKYRK
jgi:tetratricopeptide (TPR) repeat protein